MPATPARITFIINPFRRATAENPEVKAQFGSQARKSDDPVETFFDSVADAQVMADERQALLSEVRRRFTVRTGTIEEVAALDYTGGALPLVQYIDTECAIDRSMIVGELIYDYAAQSAAMNVWG